MSTSLETVLNKIGLPCEGKPVVVWRGANLHPVSDQFSSLRLHRFAADARLFAGCMYILVVGQRLPCVRVLSTTINRVFVARWCSEGQLCRRS